MGSRANSERPAFRETLAVSRDRLSDDQLLRHFLEGQDQDAFQVIVERNGPRVLGVCRQVLGHSAEVDDVFQATFLLLARKAGSIRDRSALGHWLLGVAHRIAVRSKARARRREPVRLGIEPEAPVIEDDLDRQELRQVLHEEIDRLPERFRRPVLLCYLEGRTNLEAARLLGCPPGTLKDRLAKGRETLRGRLDRRGFALSAMLLILLLSAPAIAEPPSDSLARSTARAAVGGTRRGRAISSGRAGGRGRSRWLIALASVNLAATFVAISTSTAGWPRWLAELLAMARKACH